MSKRLVRGACREGAALLAGWVSGSSEERLGHRVCHVTARLVRIGLAALIAVALMPVVQPALGSDVYASRAFAAEGSTNYESLFEIENKCGEPALFIGGNTIRPASTNNPDYYAYHAGYYGTTPLWKSASSFSTAQPVALSHDWEIRASCTIPDISVLDSGKAWVLAESCVYFKRPGNLSGSPAIDGAMLRLVRQSENGSKSNALWGFTTYGESLSSFSPVDIGTVPDQMNFVFSYQHNSDTMVLESAGKQISYKNARAQMGCNQVQVSIIGSVEWANKANYDVAQIAPGYETTLTFESISIPHLAPKIQEIRIYDAKTGSLIHDNDAVADDTVVRVECVVSNDDSRAAGESFPMHLKIANTPSYPTSGLTVFYDASHPLKVDGAVQDISNRDNTPSGENGVAPMLPGTGETTVSYYAKISQASGAAVMLSQQLIEDSFQGSSYHTVKLLSERNLEQGPDIPDDSNEPGRDYHFTRLPLANENGWNNSAVAVQFFGGDYDSFTVTPANGDAPTTLADRELWVRSTDTDGYGIELQARSAAANLISITKNDTVKIDSAAPRLSVDPALDVLVVDDRSADGSHAVSGVWRLYRTDATGSVAALARASAEQVFPLTDGVGKPTQSVANLPDGYYVAEDAAGNLSAPIKVHGALGEDDPNPTPSDPGDPVGPGNPGDPVGPSDSVPPGVTLVVPGDPNGGLPMAPTEVEPNEETGTVSALVEDVMTVPTAPTMLTPEKASEMLLERYKVTSDTEGEVTCATPALFDADGNPVDAIDQAIPGDWYIEMQITDEDGNTTTLRVRYQVRNGSVSGTMTDVSPDDNGNDASSGDKDASGSKNDNGKGGLGTVLTKLPQTGSLLGECPLHVMFLLLMVLVSAYSMMRLRQESCREEEGRYEAR